MGKKRGIVPLMRVVLFGLFVFVLGVSVVFAYNSGKPASVVGHSGEEIEVSYNNQKIGLNKALDDLTKHQGCVYTKYLLDEPLVLYSGNGAYRSGTFNANDLNISPLHKKMVRAILLGGALDSGKEKVRSYIHFKHKGSKKWVPLIDDGEVFFSRFSILWVPLDISGGSLEWEVGPVAYAQRQDLIVYGYETEEC